MDITDINSDSTNRNISNLKKDISKEDISIRDTLNPGDVGYLIHLHGWIYALECGYNHEFEGYVCKTFYDFYKKYNPDNDRIWFAEYKGQIVGAIAVVEHSVKLAQLRWFILNPEFRGLGIGRRLMDNAMDYCRSKNYESVFLETTKDQKTAIRMYEKAGFTLSSTEEGFEWGHRLFFQKYVWKPLE